MQVSWTVSGSKEAMEVQKNFKDLRKLGIRNIAQYIAASVHFPRFFFSLLPSFPSSAKIYEKLAFSKSYTILHMRLQLMWIESVLGNLVWPCSLIETSDTELSGIH